MVHPLYVLATAWRWLGPVGIALALRAPCGPWAASGLVAGAGLAAALLGALLLRTSPLGRLGWQNRLAAWLLPWGHVFAGGSLPGIVAASAGVTALLGAAGAFGPGSPWLVAAWTSDGLLAAWLLRTLLRHCHHPAQRRAVLRVLLLLAALAGAGLVAAMLDWPRLGALIAGGPPLLLAVVTGIWFGTVLTMRPTRWN